MSYEVDVISKNRPPRKLAQRLSVVSREGTGSEAGAWVELKTTEAGRTRTERGFFMRPDAARQRVAVPFDDEEPAAGATPDSPVAPATPSTPGTPVTRLKIARYQRLTPDGKLYEYPVEEEGGRLPDEEISAMDMFEFSGRGSVDSLAPDTLRVGRKVIPCRVRRARLSGAQDWEGDDTTYVNRAVMTRTYWRNPWIPVTGFARMVVEISTERVPIHPAAPPDSAARGASAPGTSGVPPSAPPAASSADTTGAGVKPPQPQEAGAAAQDYIYRANVTLTDLGYDAVPEITQTPEPAPQEAAPRPRAVIK